MTDFVRKPLGILDRIYSFVGGLRGVHRVDLASDISLVHDVSREAERSGLGGFSGYVRWQTLLQQVGAGYDSETITRVTDIQPIVARTDEDYEVWVLHAYGACTFAQIGNLDWATLTVGRDTNSAPAGTFPDANLIGTQNLQYDVIFEATAMREGVNALGTAAFGGFSTAGVLDPVRVPHGGFLGWRMHTTGALNIYAVVDFWVGPSGSTPPGVV